MIIVSAVGGGIAYVLLRASLPPPENILVGICGDLDMPSGKATLQGATLAAEQINAEGGILGRNMTIVAEDDDSTTPPYDVAVASNAMTKLITVDKADYIITAGSMLLMKQDICSEHKKILFSLGITLDSYTQRVLDDYEKYKYCFRISPCNESTSYAGMIGDVVTVANYTGFTKVALLSQDLGEYTRQLASLFNSSLPEYGLELVYTGTVPVTTTDFASYFATIEESGAEIVFPVIITSAITSFVKEWYDRQSPFVLWGPMFDAGRSDFWTLTEGKCDTISFTGHAAVGGYPLTNKTIPSRNAYIERWGEAPTQDAIGAYETLRFIFSDAIRRAGSIETEAVIRALESVKVETASARQFVFTSSHDVMVGSGSVNDPAEDYVVMCMFQWQNGTQVPVKPEAIMKEARATYKYPPWPGPWSK